MTSYRIEYIDLYKYTVDKKPDLESEIKSDEYITELYTPVSRKNILSTDGVLLVEVQENNYTFWITTLNIHYLPILNGFLVTYGINNKEASRVIRKWNKGNYKEDEKEYYKNAIFRTLSLQKQNDESFVNLIDRIAEHISSFEIDFECDTRSAQYHDSIFDYTIEAHESFNDEIMTAIAHDEFHNRVDRVELPSISNLYLTIYMKEDIKKVSLNSDDIEEAPTNREIFRFEYVPEKDIVWAYSNNSAIQSIFFRWDTRNIGMGFANICNMLCRKADTVDKHLMKDIRDLKFNTNAKVLIDVDSGIVFKDILTIARKDYKGHQTYIPNTYTVRIRRVQLQNNEFFTYMYKLHDKLEDKEESFFSLLDVADRIGKTVNTVEFISTHVRNRVYNVLQKLVHHVITSKYIQWEIIEEKEE